MFVLPVTAAQAAAPREDGSTTIAPSVVAQVLSVPASTLNQVGAGITARQGPAAQGLFKVAKLHHPIATGGKPEVLSGAFAWCPHCASESWSLAIALSRFGTLSGLRAINSGTFYCHLQATCSLSVSTCFPNTRGLSFLDAKYQSPYISFVPLVLQDVNGNNVDKPSAKENAAMNRFDPNGVFPVLDVAGVYGFVGEGYNTGVLAGKSESQIAGSLANAHSPIAKHVEGLANAFTAAICKATKGQPASVCTSSGVRAAGAKVLH